MKTKMVLVVFSILGLVSCSNEKYETIEKGNLNTAFILNSSPTFKGYYYHGTDNDFHYFSEKWNLKKDRYFKLYKDVLFVVNPFEFKEKELKIDLIKIDGSSEFGHNEYYKLYKNK